MVGLATACGLQESPLEPASPRVSLDAASPTDAGLDSGTVHPPDAGLDAAVPPADAGLDAALPPPDAGVDASPGPLPCDDRYGSADSYERCDAPDDRCAFYSQLGGQSCEDVCRDLGGQCLEARADSANGCADQGAVDCGTGQSDGICVCTRP